MVGFSSEAALLAAYNTLPWSAQMNFVGIVFDGMSDTGSLSLDVCVRIRLNGTLVADTTAQGIVDLGLGWRVPNTQFSNAYQYYVSSGFMTAQTALTQVHFYFIF